MKELNQGEEYEEEEFEGEGADYEDEGNEDTRAGFETFWGIPKKIFFIGLAGVVIVIIAIVLITTRGKTSVDSTSSDIVYPEASTATTMSTPTTVYDSSGNQIGYCEGTTDGFTIYDDNKATVGVIDSTVGEIPFCDQSGNQLGTYYVDASYVLSVTSTETITSTEQSIEDFGSDATTIKLRKLGYTGDEIELAKSMGISVDDLVKKAEALRDDEAKEALKRMSDTASDDYRNIINNSVFGLPELTFDKYDENDANSKTYDSQFVVNADYWKVPTYGNQLFIKCKIANGTYCFYNIGPSRWAELPDSGNIVLQINYTIYGTKNVNMYITSISEIDTTKITVNPQDSASDLTDIVKETSDGNSGLTSNGTADYQTDTENSDYSKDTWW